MTAPKSADNFINYRFTYLLTYHFGISPTKFLFLIAIFASFELPPSVGKVRLQWFSGWLSSIGRYFIYDSYSVPIYMKYLSFCPKKWCTKKSCQKSHDGKSRA